MESKVIIIKKIIIAGSRNFNDFDKVEYELMTYFKNTGIRHSDIEIISGTARGADRLGEQFANKYKLKLTKFPADWNKFGKSAGYKRNIQMAEYADTLFAFWDGQSKGTEHMIDIAIKNKLEVYVFVID